MPIPEPRLPARLDDLPDADPPAPRQADVSARQVFEILVREHASMLLAYLRALLRSDDAVDDLFQETMLTAWRRLGDYNHERPFAPWLRGIALRLVLRHRERRARSVPQFDQAVLEALEERFVAAHSSAAFAALAERLRLCLNRLPDQLRAVFSLVYEQGLRLRAAARALAASEEAVKKRVQRGRQLLADCLRRGEAVP